MVNVRVMQCKGFATIPTFVENPLDEPFSLSQAVIFHVNDTDWFCTWGFPEPDHRYQWIGTLKEKDRWEIKYSLEHFYPNETFNLKPMPKPILDAINEDEYIRVGDFIQKFGETKLLSLLS